MTLSRIADTGEHICSLPRVSIIIVNYNARKYLADSLSAVMRTDYPDFEVVLVDNGSSDGSPEDIERKFPGIRLFRAERNLGFGGGNNLGTKYATGDYLAFLNPDTIVEPAWLKEIVRVLEQHPDIGLATGKILLLSSSDRINTCGNDVHFTGVPACRGWMQLSHTLADIEDVSSISGAAFVARKTVFESIGGFDENFFLYVEDNDLSWRALLSGYRSAYVPSAKIYHEYVPRFGPDKLFYLERNRYQMLAKSFRWRTLFLLIPALLLSEIVTWGYALIRGSRHVQSKLRSYWWILNHWDEIQRKRRSTQRLRRVGDRRILQRCSYRLDYGLASNNSIVAKTASLIFDPLFFLLYCFYLIVIQW